MSVISGRLSTVGVVASLLLSWECSHDWGELLSRDAGSGNDASSDSSPDAMGDAVCTPATTHCRDADGDGHGDAADTRDTCGEPPTGFVDDCTDCLDSNPDVHPDQTGWFASPREDMSYDYDCSGAGERRWGLIARCEHDGSGCDTRHGWVVGVLPNCGDVVDWVPSGEESAACVQSGGSCEWNPDFLEPRKQECR